MNIRHRRYRIVPIVFGNRAKGWKLQHYGLFWWVDTKFENGKVKVKETNRDELVGLIAHLRADVTEIG